MLLKALNSLSVCLCKYSTGGCPRLFWRFIKFTAKERHFTSLEQSHLLNLFNNEPIRYPVSMLSNSGCQLYNSRQIIKLNIVQTSTLIRTLNEDSHLSRWVLRFNDFLYGDKLN